MLDLSSVADHLSAYVPRQLSAYIPYMHNTYFLVFAASSLIYLVAKLALPRRRRSGAQPAWNRPAPEHAEALAATPRVPFLRGAIAFIAYNLVIQLILCLSFFALGSQHSAQRVFGAGAVALHLLSGATFLLLCFALLGAMVALGLLLLLAKYGAVYVGNLAREFSLWRRAD